MIQNYTDLEVWNIGMRLAEDIYNLTDRLPKEETYGLASQMRRAAVSIPSNIAEGHRRNHTKEYIQFLYHALGSTAELETQLLLTANIHKIRATEETMKNLEILSRKIGRLIQSLKVSSK